MNNNSLINYNAKVIEVEDNIKQLSSTGINMEEYEKRLKEVIENTELEKEKSLVSFGKQELLGLLYDKAIADLEELNKDIEEYNFYFKMHNKYEELKSKVETAEREEIETIGKEVYDILNEIKKRTLTIAEEENLIKQIYALLYDCIKKEIIFSIGSNEPPLSFGTGENR